MIDTNVIFSAAYDPFSLAGKLIFAALEGKVTLIAPEICKDELRRNLINKLNYSIKEVDTFISVLPIIWIPMNVYESLLELAEKLIKGDDAHSQRRLGQAHIVPVDIGHRSRCAVH